MRLLIFRAISFSLCIGITSGLCANGIFSFEIHKKEFVKSIKKEYAISPDGEVSLNNKNGKVDVRTWEKNRVKVDVKITVFATSQSDADRVFKKIKLNFSNTPSSVSTETNYDQSYSWWGDWVWSSTKDKYSIDYEVHLPKTNSLKLYNRYGDVNLAAIQGPAELDLTHCNLRMEGIEKDLTLRFAYGNGTVVRTNNADLTVKCGKLKLKEAKDISLTSSYSKILIEQANDVKSESLHDTYLIGRVHEFRNQGKYDDITIEYADIVETVSVYTEVNIKNLGSSVDFDLKHGGANIVKVSKGFSELILNGSYTDYIISVEAGANYKFNASSDNSGIGYPENLEIVYENDKNDNYAIEGYIGKIANSKGFIKAKVSFGGLKVK